MIRRPATAIFLSKELDELIRGLAPEDKRRRWLEDMENVLLENIFAGDIIPKMQIPDYYVEHSRCGNVRGGRR